MKYRTFLFFCLLGLLDTHAQTTIGLPDIINYRKRFYNAGAQNWEIRQDKDGRLYFANNEGLLAFDGTYWQVHPLPNKTIVRSLEIHSSGRIYIGGQDEIGFFSPDERGRLVYTSLKHLLKEPDRNFADIWDISCFGSDVFFRSSNRIFHFRDNRFTVFPTGDSWLFIGPSGGTLLAQHAKEGLLQFRNGRFLPVNNNLPAGFQITATAPFAPDTTLLATTANGLWLLTHDRLTPFTIRDPGFNSRQHFSSAIRISTDIFAVGTYDNGCYIINKAGQTIQNFSRQSGLQNNNIRSLFSDGHKNLWLGLDNGIDFIAFDNAVKHINPASLHDGAGYAAMVFNEQLFVGLSTGVYRLPLQQGADLSYSTLPFERVPGTEGQTWGLSVVNGQLLAGMHDGLFHIKNNTAVPVEKSTGFWTLQPVKTSTGEKLLAGNYLGLQLLDYKGAAFTPQNTIPNYTGSARFLAIDARNTAWTSHPYRGVYKIENAGSGNPVVTLYTEKNGLPSSLNNHVYQIKNRIVVATEKGVYRYNRETNSFEADPWFRKIFGSMGIRYLKEDASSHIWFIREKDLGVVDFSTGEPRLLYLPELSGKMVSGFEHVYPVNDRNVLIGAEKGFYHINYDQYKKANPALTVSIRTVMAIGKNNHLLFGGYAGAAAGSNASLPAPEVEHDWNSFHIRFSSPLYEQLSNLEYSYYLEGFDKSWSVWSGKTEKDYTNLPAGNYTFRVKARNNLGNESPDDSFSFSVLPPWYGTWIAYAVYFFLACSIFYFLYKRHKKQLQQQQQKHREEQQRLLYLHQLELEKSEKEIVKLRNEKLESEIEYKNSELASTAMHLVQKGELLTKIKDELQRLNKGKKAEGDELKKIIRILSEEEKINDDWEQFAMHFNQVHTNFLITLKEKYPNLTAHELKLCAYLRMNLTSKEIAQLMNISVRGVEISRYRLRKKLGIPTDVNLFQFLLEIHASKEKFAVN